MRARKGKVECPAAAGTDIVVVGTAAAAAAAEVRSGSPTRSQMMIPCRVACS